MTSSSETRSNYLANCLLEALVDENWSNVLILLQRHHSPAFRVPTGRDVAPIHFAAGMEETAFGRRCIEQMLIDAEEAVTGTPPGQRLADVIDVRTLDGETALQVATWQGHTAVAWLLLQHGASPELRDATGLNAIDYAVRECQFELLKMFRDWLYERRRHKRRPHKSTSTTPVATNCANKPSANALCVPTMQHCPKPQPNAAEADDSLASPLPTTPIRTPAVASVATSLHTPHRIPYDFDRTSPYYINITHRDRRMQRLCDSVRVQSPPPTVQSPRRPMTASAGGSSNPKARVNLFQLTRENIQELTGGGGGQANGNTTTTTTTTTPTAVRTNAASPMPVNESVLRWRRKVAPIVRHIDADPRNSLLPVDMDDFVADLCDRWEDGLTSTLKRMDGEAEAQAVDDAHDDNDGAGEIEAAERDEEEGYQTDEPNEEVAQPLDESKFIRSPLTGPRRRRQHSDGPPSSATAAAVVVDTKSFVYQMTEKHQHFDRQRGIALYELKLKPELQMSEREREMAAQQTQPATALCPTKATPTTAATNNDDDDDDAMAGDSSCASTAFTVPLDYDTDALRSELTRFGVAPGPISSTTKRLYMKRLIRFRRNPELAQIGGGQRRAAFSIELERTLRSDDAQQTSDLLASYAALIPRMTECFQMPKSRRQLLREGHLKKSFVYLLIDPRMCENLPGEAALAVGSDPRLVADTWERFLRSIFYVGKGKNGRPFDHLYDALELYGKTKASAATTSTGGEQNVAETVAEVDDRAACKDVQLANAPALSAKIQRIHSIWSAGRGVVCRPLFHNCIPTEAFTREAAMIDALRLGNLTNVKGGDYYGTVRSWPMRERKQLGVALLRRALQVMLADGESQLRPDDLL